MRKLHPYTYAGLKFKPTVPDMSKVELIKTAVYNITRIQFEDIKSKSRFREISEARHLFHYFVRIKTNLSTIKIGKLTERDHATVVHSCKFVNDLKEFNFEFNNKLIDVHNEINSLKSICDIKIDV